MLDIEKHNTYIYITIGIYKFEMYRRLLLDQYRDKYITKPFLQLVWDDSEVYNSFLPPEGKHEGIPYFDDSLPAEYNFKEFVKHGLITEAEYLELLLLIN